MSFAPKLTVMVDAAISNGRSTLDVSIRDLARVLKDVVGSGRWRSLNKRDLADLTQPLVRAKEAARILDAGQCAFDRILAPANARTFDLRLRGDHRADQEQIRELFDTGEAPSRGFVYVAWRKTPERYLYVGKAGSVDRLNLAAHGKLARAMADATRLSLAFPPQSRNEVLKEVEASLIAVIEHHTDDLPELNDRPEPVPYREGGSMLEGLAAFVEQIAKDLRRQ